MDRIIVAFENPNLLTRVSEMLARCGYPPRFRCSSGAEVLRVTGDLAGAVVICGYKLPDMTADSLYVDLDEKAIVLVIASPAELDHCERDGLFRLPTPVNRGDLTGAMTMLTQLADRAAQRQRVRRNDSELALVERAKGILMDKNHFTEEQAHRFLQKTSMNSGCKMSETAAAIIKHMN